MEEVNLESRITLVASTVQDFADPDGFDLAWLPSFFIPEAVLDDAIVRVHGLLRPGGTIVVAANQGDKASLEAAVDDLRTIRSGGSSISASDALARLDRSGFVEVHEPDLGPVPLKLVVGRRP